MKLFAVFSVFHFVQGTLLVRHLKVTETATTPHSPLELVLLILTLLVACLQLADNISLTISSEHSL